MVDMSKVIEIPALGRAGRSPRTPRMRGGLTRLKCASLGHDVADRANAESA
jgi:hypothetical protein